MLILAFVAGFVIGLVTVPALVWYLLRDELAEQDVWLGR